MRTRKSLVFTTLLYYMLHAGEGEARAECEPQPALSARGRAGAQPARGRGHRGGLQRGLHHGRQHPQALQGGNIYL